MGFLTIKASIMRLAKRGWGWGIFPQLYVFPRNKNLKSFFHGLTENANTIAKGAFSTNPFNLNKKLFPLHF